MNILLLVCCLKVWLTTSQDVQSPLDPSDLVIVILSQTDPYHVAHAELLRKNIQHQSEFMEKDPPEVILTHELKITGSWIILPLLPYLSSYYPNKKWFLFCLDKTVINLPELMKVLSKYESKKNMWISYGLTDQDMSIIHHFVKHKEPFKYPNEASGFAMTKQLLQSLFEKPKGTQMEFSIDSSYELALFVADEAKGPRLTHSHKFCIVSSQDCASYPSQFHPCDKPVPSEKIYVAVKTCKKFRDDRIPVILNTWSKYALNIGFYTDEADESLTNSYIVPKTDIGHCAKTYGILEHARKVMNEKKIDWLLISDDDTILSLARIQKLLSCYSPKNLVAVGQRYGFRINENDGYDYLTSGAGLVLSKPLVELMINTKVCQCPHRQSADDMFLFGQCLQSLEVNITHSPAFHQARSVDYAAAYLASHQPVSFHSFWNIDPEEVYKEWFAEDDNKFFKSRTHTEL